MQQHPSFSFTTVSVSRVNILKNECEVSEAWDPSSGSPQPNMKPFTVIWDTGATHSVITPNVVTACGLKSIGVQKVYHAQGVTDDVETFLVNILLPNNVGFPGLRVTLGELVGADMLIGMDIISQGDFAVTNSNNRTKFSFRMPSMGDIDFVAESRKKNSQPRLTTPSEFTRQNLRHKRNKGNK